MKELLSALFMLIGMIVIACLTINYSIWFIVLVFPLCLGFIPIVKGLQEQDIKAYFEED